jgi:L-ascorbate metabolism protein UlaG (beta-lactamase superfamily)
MSFLKSSLLALALFAFAAAAQAATKIHWYGQAAFRIETPSGGVILIDPWLKVPTKPAQFFAALDKRSPGGRMVEMKPGEDRSY